MEMAMASRVMWSMFNGQLIIYPKTNAGTSVEITGTLTPPAYTDADLFKEMVKIPADADTEVQSLSDLQLKLVRYRVAARLFEDKGDLERASYMDGKSRVIEHKMRESHEDEEFLSSVGVMRGDPNV